MVHVPSPPPDLDKLIDSLRPHVEVVPADLAECGDVVQLQCGTRPVLYLDTRRDVEDQAWGILEAARTLVVGWQYVSTARLIRHLRLLG